MRNMPETADFVLSESRWFNPLVVRIRQTDTLRHEADASASLVGNRSSPGSQSDWANYAWIRCGAGPIQKGGGRPRGRCRGGRGGGGGFIDKNQLVRLYFFFLIL